ncbi:MAG TPA: hypothetical protein VL860_10915 [Planctomycetota bacterium]|nr:hypothetical protein [Planctomycetota bacterium]
MATPRQQKVFWIVAGALTVGCLAILITCGVVWQLHHDSYEASAEDMLPYVETVYRYRAATGSLPPSLAKLSPQYLSDDLAKQTNLYRYEIWNRGNVKEQGFTLTAPARGMNQPLVFHDDGAGHGGWYFDSNGWGRMQPLALKVRPGSAQLGGAGGVPSRSGP